MEIKKILNKPCSKNERLDFIVKQNHILGYEIKETDSRIEAWGKTQEEIEEIKKEKQKRKIQEQLEELDKKRIRAVCEPSMKTETQSWLEYYNQEITALRNLL